jgi:hypothetical protein
VSTSEITGLKQRAGYDIYLRAFATRFAIYGACYGAIAGGREAMASSRVSLHLPDAGHDWHSTYAGMDSLDHRTASGGQNGSSRRRPSSLDLLTPQYPQSLDEV